MNDAALIEALTDIQVEIQAIHIALEQQGIPAETIEALKSEVDRKEAKDAVLKKLAERRSSSGSPL
jgi:hypothetical protein